MCGRKEIIQIKNMATTKKIKKVEIPIDQKETFVSLQKNFGESGLSVEEKLQTLYELQEADNAIEKIMQLRGELPAEVAAIEDEIATLESKCARLEETISGYEQTIESAQKDIVDYDSDIDKYQKQLANIANSREFDSINKELENLNLLRLIAEKNIRESKVAIQDRKSDIDNISGKIEQKKLDLEVKKEELSTIVESTAEEEKVLSAKRAACAIKIDERTLIAYERIRTSVHNHLAVVPVYEQSCGGCFNAITPQRLLDIASGKKLVICEHCGRILVHPAVKK